MVRQARLPLLSFALLATGVYAGQVAREWVSVAVDEAKAFREALEGEREAPGHV